MATNYFRNNPPGEVLGILQSRRSLWQQGRQGLHIKDAMRNNAWASVTIQGLTLPVNDDTFQKLYGRGQSTPKPKPSLNGVTITTAGEWGHAIHVEVSFTCYLRSDFEIYDKAWMRTGAEGSIRFGYVKPYNPAEQRSKTLAGCFVTTFQFNTDSNGHYICKLKMTGPSKFAEVAEAKGGLKDSGGMEYKTKSFNAGGSTHQVTSLDELLLYDAQENGETSTDDMPDNHKVPNDFGDIIVYHPPIKGGIIGGIGKVANQIAARFADKQYTYNHEYYSLKYVVDRLINNQILEFLKSITSTKDQAVIGPVKIRCDSEVSRGYGYPVIRSADPTAMLILGGNRGKYINPENGQGKDWENGGEGAGKSINCHNGDYVDLSKIMLERTVIKDALSAAIDSSEQTEVSKRTTVMEKSTAIIYVNRFLKELFNVIARNTGNLFQMDLIENPENRKELLVVDRNNGITDTLNVFVFDPIDGDGSTRDMQISSEVGSNEYRAAMFSSINKQSDLNSTIKGDINEASNKRSSKIADVSTKIGIKVTKTLPDSGFTSDEVEGLRTLFVEYNQLLSSQDNKRKQVILYPGLGISVTMDGVWGWGIGNHIHTSLCPKDPYRIPSNGLCFNVQRVSHTIENNDWSTTLDGQLTFAAPVNYV